MKEIAEILNKVKEKKPLIHHITNWVTIYDCANIVRAVGALPVMAHAKEEVEQMASISSALVLNIGTLTTSLVEAMLLAGKKANEKQIPVVLDAVGVGATEMRTNKAKEILEKVKVDVIKGNASEIGTLAGVKAETKGVEAVSVDANLIELAKKLANEKNITVVITGKEDIIANKDSVYTVKNGHDMMGSIVGTGCMAASVIGAFAAVEKDYAKASAAALVCFGIAGELASRRATGPGSYKQFFYDEIYNLDELTIEDMEKVEKVEKDKPVADEPSEENESEGSEENKDESSDVNEEEKEKT